MDGTAILDMPGFFDTKGFWQNLAIKYLNGLWLDNIDNLKLALTVPAELIRTTSDKEYAQLTSLITEFARMFANIEAIDGSIALVVTKAGKHTTSEWVSDRIKWMLDNNPRVKGDKGSDGWLAGQVLKYVQDSVKIFHKPTGNGDVRREITLKDFDSINFSTAHRSKDVASQEDGAAVNHPSALSVASSGFLAGGDAIFLDKKKDAVVEALVQAQYDINMITQIVLNFFREQLNRDLNPALTPHSHLLQKDAGDAEDIFSRNYDFVKGLLPTNYRSTIENELELHISNKHKEAGNNFLNLRQLEVIKAVLASGSRGFKSDVETLVTVLRILKSLCAEPEFTSDGVVRLRSDSAVSMEEMKEDETLDEAPITLSEKIGGYIHTFELLVKFEGFCQKLCGVDQQANQLVDVVNECNALANDAFYSAINAIAITQQEPYRYEYNADTARAKSNYHKEAIEWLKKFPDQNNPKIIAAKVHSHYVIISILKEEDAIGEDIAEHYSALLDLNANDQKAKQELGDMYINRAKVHERHCVTLDKDSRELDADSHFAKAAKEYQNAIDLDLANKTAQQELGNMYLIRAHMYAKNAEDSKIAAAMYKAFHRIDVQKTYESNGKKQLEKAIKLYTAALQPLEAAGANGGVLWCFENIHKLEQCNNPAMHLKHGDFLAAHGSLGDAHGAYLRADLNTAEIQDRLCAKMQESICGALIRPAVLSAPSEGPDCFDNTTPDSRNTANPEALSPMLSAFYYSPASRAMMSISPMPSMNSSPVLPLSMNPSPNHSRSLDHSPARSTPLSSELQRDVSAASDSPVRALAELFTGSSAPSSVSPPLELPGLTTLPLGEGNGLLGITTAVVSSIVSPE